MSNVATLMRHVCCLGVTLGLAKARYQDDLAFAQSMEIVGEIDWISLVGEALSFFAFLEGLLGMVNLLTGARPRIILDVGRLYMEACTAYLVAYCVIGTLSLTCACVFAELDTLPLGVEALGLAAALASDLKISWHEDWAQLGWLALPILILSRTRPPASDDRQPQRADSTEWLGRILMVLLPLAAILHAGYRPLLLY